MTIYEIDLFGNKIDNGHDWTIQDMLCEVNRDRSEYWIDYNESDYIEGWDAWIEGEFYTRF